MRMRNASGDTREVPNTMWWRKVPLTRSVPNTKLRGRDGAVPVGGNSLEPREFTLEGTMQAPQGYSKSVARKKLVQDVDELLGFVSNGPVEITRSGSDDRILKCQLTDQNLDWQNPYDWLELDLTFRADNPYFFSWRTAEQRAELVNEQTFIVSTVGGNALIYPDIRIIGRTAQSINPKITNLETGEYLAFSGPIPPQQVLVVDTGRSHATLNGAGVVSKLTPLPFHFPIHPGINRLKYQGGSVGFYIAYRERWL